MAFVTISICSPLPTNKEASYGLRVQHIIYVRAVLRLSPGIPAGREHIEKHGRRANEAAEGGDREIENSA